MRKIAVFGGFLVFMLVLAGCGEKSSYSVLITNTSEDKDALFIYDDFPYKLDAKTYKAFEVEAYTQPPQNIIDQRGIASLIVKQNGVTGDYIFSDADFFELNVKNNSSFDVIIKADNFIDNGDSTELPIDAGKESNIGAKIYTRNPHFSSTINYPITIEYYSLKNIVIEGVVKNIMYVTIR